MVGFKRNKVVQTHGFGKVDDVVVAQVHFSQVLVASEYLSQVLNICVLQFQTGESIGHAA